MFNYFLIGLNVLVGGVALVLSFRDEKQRNELLRQKKALTRKYYEALVLQEISSKIGYTFNINSIAETIVLSVESLINLSTISFATLEDGFINIKTFQKEPVGQKYLDAVRKIHCLSIYETDPLTTSYKVHEESIVQLVSKNYTNIHYDILPRSYFNVPLVVNGRYLGVITITSRTPHVYDEEDMVTLYKIVSQAEIAVERLQSLIETEKKKLVSLISGIPSGAMLFVIQNGTYTLETINSSAKKFLGFHETDEVDTFRVAGRFGAGMQIEKHIMDAVNGKKSVILRDISIQNKYFNLFINPIPFSSGDVIDGVTIALADITTEKEVTEIRDSFTNMVVHELRTPMTSIRGASELLIGGKLTGDDSGKMLHIIKDSAERMLAQINDLLDAAKLQAGKFQIAQDTADINQVVLDRVESFKFLGESKKIMVKAEVDQAVQPFQFDKIRIDQVITNLMSNSLKFTQEGGTITVSTHAVGDQIQVSVSDTGIGIPEDKQAMLFSKYTQVQTIFRKDGTGLGLFICKGIVESHGGRIWIESKEGHGTTISFSIPRLTAQPQVEHPATYHAYSN